jgi:hypothetical protein
MTLHVSSGPLIGTKTFPQLLNELHLEVGSRLPPAAQGLVLPFAAVLMTLEVLLAFLIHTEILQVDTA